MADDALADALEADEVMLASGIEDNPCKRNS